VCGLGGTVTSVSWVGDSVTWVTRSRTVNTVMLNRLLTATPVERKRPLAYGFRRCPAVRLVRLRTEVCRTSESACLLSRLESVTEAHHLNRTNNRAKSLASLPLTLSRLVRLERIYIYIYRREDTCKRNKGGETHIYRAGIRVLKTPNLLTESHASPLQPTCCARLTSAEGITRCG
jgi:hypothetical protein